MVQPENHQFQSGTTKTTARKQHNNNTKSKIKIQDHTRLVESGLNHRHRRQRQYAAKERAAGGQGEERRKQKAPERHRQGGTGKGLEAKGVKPRGLLDLGGAGSSKSLGQCPDLRAPRRSRPTAPAASCRTHTNSESPISLCPANGPISLDSKAGPRVLDVRGRRRVPAYRG